MTVHRPKPAVLANQLEALAKLLRDNGETPRVLADILASRGWPAATLGNGARSSDTTSSTERAAIDPDQWVAVDDQLARTERLLWATANRVYGLHVRIMAQAPGDDPIPAGTGSCTIPTCEHFCNPRKKPHDRLRRGFCPNHYNRWLTYGKPDRTTFLLWLKETAA
jgi:hypothetical protein